jgi:hypothetical protein
MPPPAATDGAATEYVAAHLFLHRLRFVHPGWPGPGCPWMARTSGLIPRELRREAGAP